MKRTTADRPTPHHTELEAAAAAEFDDDTTTDFDELFAIGERALRDLLEPQETIAALRAENDALRAELARCRQDVDVLCTDD